MTKYFPHIIYSLAGLFAVRVLLSVFPFSCYKAGEMETVPVVLTKYTAININLATFKELESLDGIGSVTAGKILRYREKNGPFKNIDELKNVEGVNAANFNRLKAKLKTD